MPCIVLIYDGADAAEAATVDAICHEADPERGPMCEKIAPTAYRLYSTNTSEMKLARIRQHIKTGKLCWMRMEDDEFRTYQGGQESSKRLSW